MLRAIVCLCSIVLLTATASAQYSGFPLPWPERADPNQPILSVLDELAAPEVSGKDLAAQVDEVSTLWRNNLEQRAAMANSLAAVAAKFEDDGRYIEALVLYDMLWTKLPVRQDTIGKIKRDHALADMPLDLSTPADAFDSLKRALLTYRLTSPTFGITDIDTPIYEQLPIERHEWEAMKKAEAAMTEEERDAGFRRKWDAPLERLGPPIVPKCCRAGLFPFLDKTVSADFTDALLPDVLARLSADAGVPLAPVRQVRKRIADERVTLKLRKAPLKEVLRYVLRYKNLRYTPGNFSFLIEDIEQRPDEGFRTVVIEQEPLEHFPDDAHDEFAEMATEPSRSLLVGIVGSDEIPQDWFVRINGGIPRGVVTAPAEVVGRWCGGYSTAEIGRYYGRVLPLLRCLRRYPLPGPYVRRDIGHPKARYICTVQYRRQVQAIQALLDDREAVAGLLAADLLDVDGAAPNRYEPHFSPTVRADLAARIGLWFDGKSYRFLLFDTEQDRQRWLDGADWTDVPSDIDNYDWPTEEEWQKQLEEINTDADESAHELEQVNADAEQPAKNEE